MDHNILDHSDNGNLASPRFSLLESVSARFEQQKKEKEERLSAMRTKREVEVAHSQYLKKNVIDVNKMPEAKFVVGTWAHKHGKVERMSKRLSEQMKNSHRRKKNTPFKNRSNLPHAIGRPSSGFEAGVETPGSSSNDSVIMISGSPSSEVEFMDLSSPSASMSSFQASQNYTATVTGTTRNCPNTPRDVVSSSIESYTRPDSESAFLVLDDSLDEVASTSQSQSAGESTSLSQSARMSTGPFQSGSESENKYRCDVLYCNAVFSSSDALNQHYNRFAHSPCNPLLLNLNCELTDNLQYMCPKCSKIFKNSQNCQTHMGVTKHLPFLSPFRLGGYICVQCLHIFKTHKDCESHMQTLRHRNVIYPFTDDIDHGYSRHPIPVSYSFAQEFCKGCEIIPYTVDCIDCQLTITSASQLSDHMKETDNKHILSSSSPISMMEVFAAFLQHYCCDNCGCICDEIDTNTRHQCSKNESGQIIEMNAKTFIQFIRMCSIRSELSALSSRVESSQGEVHNGVVLKSASTSSVEINLAGITLKENSSNEMLDQNENITCADILKKEKKRRKLKASHKLKQPSVCRLETESGNLFAREGVPKLFGCELEGNTEKFVGNEHSQKKDSENVSLIEKAEKRTPSPEKMKKKTTDRSTGNKTLRSSPVKMKTKATTGMSNSSRLLASDGKRSSTDALANQFDWWKDVEVDGTKCFKFKQDEIERKQKDKVENVEEIKKSVKDNNSAQIINYPSEVKEKNDLFQDLTFMGETSASDKKTAIISIDVPKSNIEWWKKDQTDWMKSFNFRKDDNAQQCKSDVENTNDGTFVKNNPIDKNKTTHSGHVYDTRYGRKTMTSDRDYASCYVTKDELEWLKNDQAEWMNSFNDNGQGNKDESGHTADVAQLDMNDNEISSSGFMSDKVDCGAKPKWEKKEDYLKFITSISTDVDDKMSSCPKHKRKADISNSIKSVSTDVSDKISSCSKSKKKADISNSVKSVGTDVLDKMSSCPKSKIKADVSSSIEETVLLDEIDVTDPSNLVQMKNIVFLDLDNWGAFFQKLPHNLPDTTFVWGFYGGGTVWKEPVSCPVFCHQKRNRRFYLHDKCGSTKDAADFAICLTVGKLDVSLPKHIAFTLLSGDKGFCEIERQLKEGERKVVLIDPHDAQKLSDDMIYALVNSVSDQ